MKIFTAVQLKYFFWFRFYEVYSRLQLQPKKIKKQGIVRYQKLEKLEQGPTVSKLAFEFQVERPSCIFELKGNMIFL